VISALRAIAALVLLLCSFQLRAEQPPPVSAASETSVPIDVLVGALLRQGRLDEADSVLEPFLRAEPRNTELRFLSGLVAMEQGDNQRAIRIFRAILIDHPKAERVRLELARAFFAAKDYGNAWRQFQFARAGHPPASVRVNIDKYLYAIRQAKSLSYSVDVSLAPDTNLNTGSSSREVTLYGLPFDLSDDAQRHSGVGLNVTATGEWAPRLNPVTRLRIGVSAQRRDYSGSRFDDMTLAAFAGPRFVTPRWDLSVLGTANKRWYGAKPYNMAVGARLTATYYATPQLGLTTEIAGQSVDYDQARYMTGPLISLSETVVYALTPSSGTTVKSGVSRQSARVDAYSNWSGYLAVGYFRDLPAGFSAYVETSVSLSSYDSALAAFGQRRVDIASSTMVNLLNRHIVLSRFTPRLTYTFTHQHSTIPLYSFDRNRIEMGLTTVF
jgi:outer membrane protein